MENETLQDSADLAQLQEFDAKAKEKFYATELVSSCLGGLAETWAPALSSRVVL